MWHQHQRRVGWIGGDPLRTRSPAGSLVNDSNDLRARRLARVAGVGDRGVAQEGRGWGVIDLRRWWPHSACQLTLVCWRA